MNTETMEEGRVADLSYLASAWPPDPDKPTLIFLHGAGGTASYWVPQLTALGDVANVIALSLPGHDKSDGSVQNSVVQHTMAVMDAVLESGAKRILLAGFSLGSAIALQALVDYPDVIEAGILIGAGAKLKVARAIKEAIPEDFEAYLELVRKTAAAETTDEAIIAPAIDGMREAGPEVVLADFMACDPFDLRERIGEIATPVLIISAEEDQLTPPKYAAFLEQQIPRSRRVHILDAGHLVSMEQPEAVNKAIRNLISDI